MTDTTETDGMETFFERMSETYTDALRRNMDAQAAFADSWMESMEEAMSEERLDDASEGAVRAYEAWMDAAESSYERVGDALEGEDVDPEEFRDIWFNAANKAFKESMSTTAFAAATGQNVDDVLDFQSQLNEAAEETLHGMGFATTGDVREVGERLVELERRHQSIDRAVDRLDDDVRDRFDAVDSRFDVVDDRFDAVEQGHEDLDDRFDAVDDRFDAVEQGHDDLEERLDRLGDDVRDRFDDVETRFDAVEQGHDDLDQKLDRIDVSDRLEEIESRQRDIDEKLDRLLETAGDAEDTDDTDDTDENE
jgi:chromosome segregation ATPase